MFRDDQQLPTCESVGDDADALFKGAWRRSRRWRGRIAAGVILVGVAIGYLATGGGSGGSAAARTRASSSGRLASAAGHELNIVPGNTEPALPYVMGDTLRLAPGTRSYRLVGYSSTGICRSLLRSANGRYVMYGVSQGGWPALDVLDLSSGARFTFRTHACDPAWGSDGQIAYVHYVSYKLDSINFSARVLVQHGLGGAPRAWTGDGPWADPIWAGGDLLSSNGAVLTALNPGPLVILYGPGRQRIVERRPGEYRGPYSTVVAVNPSGTEALLDTERLGPGGGGQGAEDLATLLRVRDDKVLSTVRVAQGGGALAADGSWSGSEIITTDGVFDGGSSHPPATLVTLTATGNRVQLRSIKPFVGQGLEPFKESQDLAEPSQARFLDASGRHVAVWFNSIGFLRYLDCDTITGQCAASPNYIRYAGPSPGAGAGFASNPSRP